MGEMKEKKTKKEHKPHHVLAGALVINPLVMAIALMLYVLSAKVALDMPALAPRAGMMYFFAAMVVPLAPLVFAARKHWAMARWMTFVSVVVLIMAKVLYDFAVREAVLGYYVG